MNLDVINKNSLIKKAVDKKILYNEMCFENGYEKLPNNDGELNIIILQGGKKAIVITVTLISRRGRKVTT